MKSIYMQIEMFFKFGIVPLLVESVVESNLFSAVFIYSSESTETFKCSRDWFKATPSICIAEYVGDIGLVDMQIVQKGNGLRDGTIYNPFLIDDEYRTASKLMVLNLTLKNWKNFLEYTEALRKNNQNSFDTLFLVKQKEVSEEIIELFNADAVLFAEKPFRKKELIQQLFGDTTRKL